MKNKFFTLLALCLTTVFAVKAADSEVYTSFDQSTGTLTYFFDDQREARQAAGNITEVYDPVNKPNAVRFKEYDTQVTKAVIDPSMKDAHLTSTYKMFYGGYDQKSYKLSNMSEIEGMENLVTDEVWSMSCMFQFCYGLQTIDLSSFNTDNVTDMWGMFYLCWGLTSLDVSKFNTENVYDMGYMFSNCEALTSLDLSNFNIASVTNMESMFAYDAALTTIICNDVWSQSTTLGNSTDMFSGCSSLIGGLGTACDGVNGVDISYARPDGENGMPGYFTGSGQGGDPGECTSEGVEVYTEFDASTGILTYYYDDQRCSREGKTEVYDPGALRFESYHGQITKAVIDPSMQQAGLTSTAYMFFGGWGETELKLSAMTEIEGLENLVTDNVTDMHGMFDYCTALLSLDLRSFNTAKVTDMSFMFSGCSALRSLDISTFNTARVTTMSGMFAECSALASLDLSSFNTSNVTNMSSMFSQSGLSMLDLSSFNTAKVTTMSGMFYACNKLVSLNVSSFNTAKVKSMRQMFLQCSFTSIDLSSFNTSSVTDMKGMFSQCLYLRSLNVGSFNTANVTNMNSMFDNCYYLTTLDLRSFNIAKVTDMSGMFNNCQRLTTIWCAGDWSQSSVLTNSSNMFKNCSTLEGDKGTKCDGVNKIDKTYARPDEVGVPGYFTAEKISGDPEVYTEYKDGVLTYYYDNKRTTRKGITEPYNPTDDPGAIRFREYHDQIAKAKIDASMQDAHLISTFRMFFGGLAEYYGEERSYPLTALTEIEGMENLVTDEVTDMSWMFYGCSLLGSLDATHLNTANVLNYGRMFDGCSSLTELDVNSFDISKAAYLYSMFEGCSSLRTIRCNRNWSLTTASAGGMFKGCTSLVGGEGTACDGVNTIDQSYARPDYGQIYHGYFTGKYPTEVYTSFDTETETLTYYYDDQRYFREGTNEVYDPINAPNALRFKGYRQQVKKVKIDATMKNAGLTSMKSMFYGGYDTSDYDDLCLYATVIEGMENLVTDNVTDMSDMFHGCHQLTSLDLSHFNTSKVTNMSKMFINCGLSSLDLSHFTTDNVKYMNSMFHGCELLTSLNLNSFNVSKVKDMRTMFTDCSALKIIFCSYFWNNITVSPESGSMFRGCTSLVGGKGTQCDGTNNIDIAYAHPDAGKRNPGYFTTPSIEIYTSYDASTQTLTYYYDDQRFFRAGINELYDPVDAPDTRRFKEYHNQVRKAVVDVSMKNARLTSAYEMFYGGDERVGGTITYYALQNMTVIEGLENLFLNDVTTMKEMFRKCASLTSIDLSQFKTSSVKDMELMFEDCRSLTSIDLNPFDIAKLETTRWMFSGCTALKRIWCSNDWSQSSALTMSFNMFSLCTSLVGGYGTTCDGENNIEIAYAHPDEGKSNPGYFSEQKTEVYTSFNETTGVLTYFYDDQRLFREGINEPYDPVNAPDYPRFSDYHELVTKAVIDASMKNANLASMYRMFNGGEEEIAGERKYYELSKLTEISGMENLVTDNVTTMEEMFYGCTLLSSLNLSHFNTGKVTDMNMMFYNCASLTSLDLSHFNTDNVTKMNSMFGGCFDLTTLDVSNFNTAKVINMSSMFYNCRSLTSLDVSHFNTDKVMTMHSMFEHCESLISLDLSQFNIDKVTNMSRMFAECPALKTIICNNDWSQSTALTNSKEMFKNCTSLVGGKGTKYDENHIDKDYAHPDGGSNNRGYFLGKKTEIYTAFDEATGTLTYYYDDQRTAHEAAGETTEPYDPVFNPSAVRFAGYHDQVTKAVIDPSMKDAHLTATYNMFYGEAGVYLSKLEEISGMENLVTDEVTYMDFMFQGCFSLKSIDLSHLNTANVRYMGGMFISCSSLTSLDLSHFDTRKVENMSGMFLYCSSLTSLDVSHFNTDKVRLMSTMFANCESLTSLDLSSFNTYKVETVEQMFAGCSALKTIICNDDWIQSATLTNSNEMFKNCTSLVGGKGTTYDENHIDAAYAHPDKGDSNPGYFTAAPSEVYSSYNASTKTLTYYYDGRRAQHEAAGEITEPYEPVCNFIADHFEDYYDQVLTAVIDKSMQNAGLTSTYRMFSYLSNLSEIVGMENLVTDEVTNMMSMFIGCNSLTSIDLRHLNTAKVTDMGSMFSSCGKLVSLDLNSFNTSMVRNMGSMFSNCNALQTIYCNSDWSRSSELTSADYIFYGCTSLAGGKGTTYDENHIDKAYAHPDEGDSNPGYFTAKPEVYSSFDESTGVLTYYYDSGRFFREGVNELYDPDAIRFADYHDKVLVAKIDESMRTADLTTMSHLFCSTYPETYPDDDLIYYNFYEFSNLTEIEGIGNLVTDKVESMNCMFRGCSSLKELDLTGFNISKVTNMNMMFHGCTSLTTIYCEDDWSKGNVSSIYMFAYCTSLVGGSGTKYDENHIDVAYAHPDEGDSNPGYFTKKEVYTSFNESTGVLTYYYDDQRASRKAAGETTESYDPVNNPNTLRFEKYSDQVTKAVIDPSMKDAGLTSTREMFYGGYDSKNHKHYDLHYMTEIEGMKNLVTDKVTDMSDMFEECNGLISLDLSSFNTANVTNMEGMFADCYALSSINLSSFVTDNVTNMNSMFWGCTSLTSLDVSHFVTDNVTDMEGMFLDCWSLTMLNLSSFNIDNVTQTDLMFSNCTQLQTIICNKYWSSSSLLTSATSSDMFKDCKSLVGGMGTKYDENHTDIGYAHPDGGLNYPGYFYVLKTEVYTSFNETTRTLTYYYDDQRLAHEAAGETTESYDPVNKPYANRFVGYADLVLKAKIDPSMQNAGLTSTYEMFCGYEPQNQVQLYLSNLMEIEDMENLITDDVTNMKSMFEGCAKLTSINLSSLNTDNVTDMNGMFYGCHELSSLDLSHFYTANVTDMSWMFSDCNKLTSLDLRSFNTANVTDMGLMFSMCWSLKSLDLSMFNIDKVYSMNLMFEGCSALESIYCGEDWSKSSTLTTSDQMFYGCRSLVGGNGTTYDVNNTDVAYAHPDGGDSNPGYFTLQSPTIEAQEDPDNTGVFYSTFYNSAIKYQLPAGIEAYVATVDQDGNLNMTKVAENGQILPANVAVILKSNVASFTLIPSDGNPVTITVSNDLQGTDFAMPAPQNCYVLRENSMDNTVVGIGFYLFDGTLAAHNAYMIYAGAGSPQHRMRMIFDGEEGIDKVQSNKVQSTKVLENGMLYIIRGNRKYDATGRLVK